MLRRLDKELREAKRKFMPKTNNHEEEAATAQPDMPPLSQQIENVLLLGDLSKLTSDERLAYYNRLCHSLKLNPYTKPFEYLLLNGKLQLYARKDCTEQLRKIHGISLNDPTAKHEETLGIYVVNVTGRDRDGRTDFATGAVSVAGLKGDSLANAIMKAETKAKRRFTLSICGLGMLDEAELDTIPQAREPLPRPPKRVKQPELAAAPANEEVPSSPAPIESEQKEVKPEPEPAAARGKVKAPNFRVKFWQEAKRTGKSNEEIRNYIGWMGYERTADIPEDKQQECLDWAASG